MEPNGSNREPETAPVAPAAGAGPSVPAASRRRSTRYTAVSWVLVAVWAGFIFFMSSNTSTGLNDGLGAFSRIYQVLQGIQAGLLGPGTDVLSSIAHFCEYAVFGALLANALHCHMPLQRAAVLAIVCASLYGVSDEIHQLFVPTRMCDPADWAVDTFGAALGASIALLTMGKRNSRNRAQ